MKFDIKLPMRASALVILLLVAGCGSEVQGRDAGAADEARADSAAIADSLRLAEEAEAAAAEQAAAAVLETEPSERPIIRGIYLNAYAAGSGTRLPRLLALADSTEINAFVVDVKDERGIHYRGSEVALANEITAPGELTIRDLEAFVDTLHAHDIHAIARIVLYKDPVLSKAKPDWSVKQPNGELWVDKAGNTWVSPWDQRVWEYNLAIAEEAARAGFDEIQFDYVRFAEPYQSLPAQVHPRAEGTRTDAIAAFLNEAKRRLHPLGAVVAADVFGLSPNTYNDVGIGQQWETIASTADHILPMMYPSHYLPTHLPNVPRPDLMPYEVLYKSAGMAVVRNRGLTEAGVQPARIIPWLQAFTATWLREHLEYGPEALEKQKQGVYDVGLEDWILWHPGSRYEHLLPALERTAEPRAAQDYTPPADVRSVLASFESRGVSEARQRAAEQARGETEDPEAAAAARTGSESGGG